MFKYSRYFTLTVVLAAFIILVTLNESTFFTSIQPSRSVTSNEKRSKPVSNKILCRMRPEYSRHEEMKLDSKTVNNVEAMLMFIAFQRTGHTLMGSSLDAHPNMVIANEYDILSNWKKYAPKFRNRQYLFEQLYANSYLEAHEGDRSSKDCLPKSKYHYVIPNQWQGQFDKKIKIIGDKKGGGTVELLTRSPKYASFLQEIQRIVKVPVKFLHVVRNPFDNIATIELRNMFGYDLNWTNIYNTPVKISKKKLIKRISSHTRLEKTITQLKQQLGDLVHTVKSEDFIANPELELRKICRFLNIQCSLKYINDCISIVYSKISKSRNGIIWDKDTKDMIFKFMKPFPYYNGYKFEE